ncbi:hypothetical protein C8F01DRAFT_1376791 [Mycena amicta]|nr:hypothetical protein C8F01DRAFT_1376791 [Mycena amicta]
MEPEATQASNAFRKYESDIVDICLLTLCSSPPWLRFSQRSTSSPLTTRSIHPNAFPSIPAAAFGANNVIRIQRQVDGTASPSADNGIFENRALSRKHAEVWLSEDHGISRVLIRDVKSSNGTFVNGERLSAEGLESEPRELQTDDILEFGSDIIDDQGEIISHKVTARATCAFTLDEAEKAVEVEQEA